MGKLIRVDTETGEILAPGTKSDGEWETYIRSASVENTIVDRGRRWLEFYTFCQTENKKSGGSHFSTFAIQRFNLEQSEASRWVSIGRSAAELMDNIHKFAPDWRAMYDWTRLPDDHKKVLLESGEKISQKAIRELKLSSLRDDRLERISAASASNVDLEIGQTYPVLYADPPWRYEHVKTESRAIENQYPTMELVEICALPVSDLAASDAILFLWATSPKLAEAMAVVSAWGFTYRTCAVWAKPQIGMGYYFRQQHELLLVATRGSLPAPEPKDRPGSVVTSNRTKHSEKPPEFSEFIEAMYPTLQKIELFCRTPRDGWDVWGNQSGA